MVIWDLDLPIDIILLIESLVKKGKALEEEIRVLKTMRHGHCTVCERVLFRPGACDECNQVHALLVEKNENR